MKKIREMKWKLAGGLLLLAVLSGCGQSEAEQADVSNPPVMELEAVAAEPGSEAPDEVGETDLQEAVEAWAEAFCTRNGEALWNLFDPARRDDFYEMDIVQSGPEDDFKAIGWSSPWTMDRLYMVETEGEQSLITYYPMTSNPHRWVWKQSVSWKQADGHWYGYADSFKMYDSISTAETFADAYSDGISGTPMDYRTDCEDWADVLENLAESEDVCQALLTTPDKAAEYLLNMSDGSGTIEQSSDRTARVIYQFADKSQVSITMIQPKGKTIWLPEQWEETVFGEEKEESFSSATNGELIASLAGKWRLAGDKTEANFKEIDGLQSMFGTSLHLGNEMEIGQDGSFRFYLAISLGGEGTVKEKDGHLQADIEPYEPEGRGGSPAQFEIVPVTEDGILYLTTSNMGETLYWERLNRFTHTERKEVSL